LAAGLAGLAGLAAAAGLAVEGRFAAGFLRAAGGGPTRRNSTKTGFGTSRGVPASASPGAFWFSSDAPVIRTGTVCG
jgi:hypothetical protein